MCAHLLPACRCTSGVTEWYGGWRARGRSGQALSPNMSTSSSHPELWSVPGCISLSKAQISCMSVACTALCIKDSRLALLRHVSGRSEKTLCLWCPGRGWARRPGSNWHSIHSLGEKNIWGTVGCLLGLVANLIKGQAEGQLSLLLPDSDHCDDVVWRCSECRSEIRYHVAWSVTCWWWSVSVTEFLWQCFCNSVSVTVFLRQCFCDSVSATVFLWHCFCSVFLFCVAEWGDDRHVHTEPNDLTDNLGLDGRHWVSFPVPLTLHCPWF